MKRTIIIAAVMGMCCLWTFALSNNAPIKMPEDDAHRPIPGMAPHPDKDRTLTGVSIVVAITDDIAWKVYSPTGGIFRVMTSATKAGVAHTIPTSSWTGEVVNHKKYTDGRAFLNISGAQNTSSEKATLRRE